MPFKNQHTQSKKAFFRCEKAAAGREKTKRKKIEEAKVRNVME
jgi:hypothetical protein